MVFCYTKITKSSKLREFPFGFLNCEHEPTTNFHINFIFMSCACRTILCVKEIIIKSLITDVHTVDSEFSGSNVQFPFTGCVTWTGSAAILVIILRFSSRGWSMDKHNPVLTAPSLIFVPGDLFIKPYWYGFRESKYNFSIFFYFQYHRIFEMKHKLILGLLCSLKWKLLKEYIKIIFSSVQHEVYGMPVRRSPSSRPNKLPHCN